MQKVLVTGASGFLGKSVVNYLKNKNYYVRATGRNAHELNRTAADEQIVLDLTKETNLDTLVQGCDAIVHCAALSSPWGNPQTFIDINVKVTQKLAQSALKENVTRFVHISSPSIYMGMSKKENISEDDTLPKQFVNWYAKTKYEAEVILDELTKQGLPVLTIRPQALFGPNDTVLMPRFFKANDAVGIPLIAGGTHKLDLTFVDNVAHAVYLSLCANENLIGQKFNITNNSPVVFKTFVEDLFKKIHKTPKFKKIPLVVAEGVAYGLETFHNIFKSHNEPVLTRYTVKVLSESRTLNISRATQLLGYKPIVSFEEGIEKFARWWLSHDQKHTLY